jgi:hypothetical protein
MTACALLACLVAGPARGGEDRPLDAARAALKRGDIPTAAALYAQVPAASPDGREKLEDALRFQILAG